MGFYLRKSIRLGPLRFNLSKSGIGVSTGIRGLRIGTGPRGNYIHMGAGGFYYRQTLPSDPRSGRQSTEPPPPDTDGAPLGTYGEMKAIASGSVTQMMDSSSAALLAELDQKRAQLRLCPLVVGLSVAVTALLAAAKAPLWLLVATAALLLIGILLARQRDALKKTAIVMYDLDDNSLAAYRRVHAAVEALAKCGATWHVTARAEVYNRKYHAGAGHLLDRKRVYPVQASPPFVRTNLPVSRLRLGGRSLFFFPDRILVYAPNGVGSVIYRDLKVEVDTTRFIEDGGVPRDAQIVDHTWRYVNKGGGPDRRFGNNCEIPICLYEQIRLCSGSGLNELLQVSCIGLGDELRDSIFNMSAVLATAERTHQLREEEERVASMYDALFSILCCAMVADGRASRSEKALISELMHKVHAPWPTEMIADRISEFILEVQNKGYPVVSSHALSRVGLFREPGRAEALLKCIEAIGAADGALTPPEKAFYERVRGALTLT